MHVIQKTLKNKNENKTATRHIFLICTLAVFALLVVLVDRFNDRGTLLYRFDKYILEFIRNNFSGGINDKIFASITVLGNAGIFWIAVSAVLIIKPETRKVGLSALLAIIIGFILGNLLIKTSVERLRPYQLDETIRLIIKAPSEYSFPSGHTLCSFGCATAIFINRKKLGAAMLVIASLIAFSRLYLYVHYPTDVVGGILLGILTANLADYIVNKSHKHTGPRLAGSN